MCAHTCSSVNVRNVHARCTRPSNVPMSVQNSWKSMVSELFVSHSFIIFCRSSSLGFSPNDSRTLRSSSVLIAPLPSCEAIGQCLLVSGQWRGHQTVLIRDTPLQSRHGWLVASW